MRRSIARRKGIRHALTLAVVLTTAQSWLPAAPIVIRPQYDPQPRPPELRVEAAFYDETGGGGLVSPSYPYFPIAGAKTEIFFDGSQTPTFVSPRPYISREVDESWRGRAFDFRITIPTLGVFEGSSYVEAFYLSVTESQMYYLPRFVIRTTPQDLGHDLTVRSEPHIDPPPPNGQTAGVTIRLFGGNSDSSGTFACDFHVLAGAAHPELTLTVDYLPGCNLRYRGSQSVTIRQLYDSNHDYDAVIYWSGYGEAPYPFYAKLGDIAPVGPVRVTAHVPGYTTDTVTLSLSNLRDFHWDALILPLPPPWSSDRPEGVSFHQVSVSIFPEIRAAVVGMGSTSAPMDQNQDGAVDAADLVSFLTAIPTPASREGTSR